MNDNEGDGQALMSAEHPIEVTQVMIEAGVLALRQRVDHLLPVVEEFLVGAVFRAMCRAAPPWPEDISEDAIEDMPAPQAMVDAEVERLAKILLVSDGYRPEMWEEGGNIVLKARFLSYARVAVEALWGRGRP